IEHIRQNRVGTLRGIPADQITAGEFTRAWASKWNAAPMEDAPISREDTLNRIESNPVMQANPKLKFQTIAYVRQQTELFNQEHASEIDQLKKQVPGIIDSIAEGAVDMQIPVDKIRALMPGPQGQDWLEEYQVAKSIGTQMNSIKFASPQEVEQ